MNDFFLNGIIGTILDTIEKSKARIGVKVDNVPQEEIQNTLEIFKHRLCHCHALNERQLWRPY